MKTSPKHPPRPQDCATAWFAVWECARIDGDRERERQALENLRRLGVVVASADDRQGVVDEA